MLVHEVIAEEPEMKSVGKDELFQKLENILRRSVAAARLTPEYTRIAPIAVDIT